MCASSTASVSNSSKLRCWRNAGLLHSPADKIWCRLLPFSLRSRAWPLLRCIFSTEHSQICPQGSQGYGRCDPLKCFLSNVQLPETKPHHMHRTCFGARTTPTRSLEETAPGLVLPPSEFEIQVIPLFVERSLLPISRLPVAASGEGQCFGG